MNDHKKGTEDTGRPLCGTLSPCIQPTGGKRDVFTTLTNLNVVRSDVEGCHQALQEIADPSEVGASDAPGAVHQQHDVCCCIAGTLKWFPWRRALITGKSLEQIRLLQACGIHAKEH